MKSTIYFQSTLYARLKRLQIRYVKISDREQTSTIHEHRQDWLPAPDTGSGQSTTSASPGTFSVPTHPQISAPTNPGPILVRTASKTKAAPAKPDDKKPSPSPSPPGKGVKRAHDLQGVKVEPVDEMCGPKAVAHHEKIIRTVIAQLQAVLLQASEIVTSVQSDDDWSWLNGNPRFVEFQKNQKKLIQAKEQKTVKTLLMNRCDFGHVCFLLTSLPLGNLRKLSHRVKTLWTLHPHLPHRRLDHW